MPYFKATIELLVEADCEAEACDCISETLRGLLDEFSPPSPLIDWRYAGPAGEPQPDDGAGFEYARPSDPRCPDRKGGSDVSAE